MMHDKPNERGFVLITTLVVLLILTIMSVGLYFRSAVNQQTSASDRDTTKAFYLAETALNYIAWAIHSDPEASGGDNDANLDGDTTGVTGDRSEIVDPSLGPASVGYFDTSAPGGRTIDFNNPASPPTPVLATVAPYAGNGGSLPNHVTLNIVANNVSAVWSGGTGFPASDGAIVWLTAAELDSNAPANETDSDVSDDEFAIYAYVIGYVNGTPMRMLRARVGKMEPNTSGLGSLTNGNQ